MKRDPAACLADMLDYAREAEAFVAGMTVEDFLADRKTQFAALRALEVIGEAAGRVPQDVRDLFPDTPWRSIVGMRNIIAHDYLGIRPERIFETIRGFVPEPVRRLPDMITTLSPP